MKRRAVRKEASLDRGSASAKPSASAGRNPGCAFNADWVASVRVNRSAVERRADTLPKRRTVKKDWQAAWLLKAVRTIDLTTLSGDDTPGTVHRICAKARQPVREDLLAALGVPPAVIHVGAVCVYHALVPTAVEALRGSGIPVAAVSTGFPAGLNPFELRVREIEMSVEAGAREIDIVISRGLALTGHWKALYDEVRTFRKACGRAHMKTILATGELGTLTNVARASLVCMMAGADFIKTSTGKIQPAATMPVTLVMLQAIRDHYRATGRMVGMKPAGGIAKAKQAIHYLVMLRETLGEAWLTPDWFRFGASSLANDLLMQLEKQRTGVYQSADYFSRD